MATGYKTGGAGRKCHRCGKFLNGNHFYAHSLNPKHGLFCGKQCAQQFTGIRRRQPLVRKNCKECGKTFEIASKYSPAQVLNRRFCSYHCAAIGTKREKGMMIAGWKKCALCGTDFFSKLSKTRFCSGRCGSHSHTPPTFKKCPTCGNDFRAGGKSRPLDQQYCSKGCAYTGNSGYHEWRVRGRLAAVWGIPSKSFPAHVVEITTMRWHLRAAIRDQVKHAKSE